MTTPDGRRRRGGIDSDLLFAVLLCVSVMGMCALFLSGADTPLRFACYDPRREAPDSRPPEQLGTSFEVGNLTFEQTLGAWNKGGYPEQSVLIEIPKTTYEEDRILTQCLAEMGLGLRNNCGQKDFDNDFAQYRNWNGRVFLEASIKNATLIDANIMSALFLQGSVEGTSFKNALLGCAEFRKTNLKGARFESADLRGVILAGAEVADADFSHANLAGAVYEPRTASIPNIPSIASALNLQWLKYERSPASLIELRDAFYKNGMEEHARKITFAIEHTRRVNEGESNDPLVKLVSWLRLVAFEWPVAYGMYPFRPLLVLLVLIPAFVPFYVPTIYHDMFGGLWIRRPKDAINRKVVERWLPLHRIIGNRPLRQLKVALWFSIMCAFRIGYKDVNVGDWITRLQSREYLLGAKGLCRSIAGLQSLISVYLLALTVLCVIGRPFG